MSFTLLTTRDEVAQLPDGTLITWLPVHDDVSSEACAFVRRGRYVNQSEQVRETVWIAPGNGWEPEGLDVLVFPVRVLIREGWIAPHEISEDELATLSFAGGTYPRDVALQAAAAAFAGNQHLSAQLIVNFAETFARWLTGVPVENSLDSGQIDPISFGTADEPYLGHDH